MTLHIYKMDHGIPMYVPGNLKLEYITQGVKRYKEMVVTQKFLYTLVEERFG